MQAASPDSARHQGGGHFAGGHFQGGSKAFGKQAEDTNVNSLDSARDGSNLKTPSSITRMGPRLRAEGVMVPPASDAATLRRQVAALQLDLENHMEGETRLQGINQQLRERLELYMKQNHENVERAENELNTLHEDMEQTLELQRRLAQRASLLEKEKKELEETLQKRTDEYHSDKSSLQARIESMSEDLTVKKDAQVRSKVLQAELESALAAKRKLEEQLSEISKETETIKKRAEEYNNELNKLIAKEKRNLLLDTKGRKLQLRRCFQWFLEGVREYSVLTAHEDAAFAFARNNCSRRGLRALKVATVRAVHMRVSEQRRAQHSLHECWRSWRLFAIARRMHDGALLNRERSCKSDVISRWKRAVEMGKFTVEEEQALTAMACKYRDASLSRWALRSWFHWIVYWARPRQRKLKGIQERLDRLTCKEALHSWKLAVDAKHGKHSRMERAETLRLGWLERRALQRWKSFAAIVRLGRSLKSKGLAFWKLHQSRAVVHAWKEFLQLRKIQKHFISIASKHYNHTLKSKGISIWRRNLRYQRAEVHAVRQVNQALMRTAFSLWQDYHAARALKKRKEVKASLNCNKRLRKMAKACFVIWWEETLAKKLHIRLAYKLAIQRMHAKMRSSLRTWLQATFDHLLVTNSKLHQEILNTRVLVDEQKEQSGAVELENLQLIDRLHCLSSEIASLKVVIADKEKVEEDLHRALEDGALIESSMQGELDQQRTLAHELQAEVLRLQRKLQKKNIEDTEGEVHQTMANQKLQRTVKELQRQLAEKAVQMDAYERALKETAEKLEGASDESHEKLSNAFEIAATLRKILEDRESQFAALEGNCRRKELELGEIQKKLEVTHSAFAETVEARDARIHELENMLAQKQAEVQESQVELQETRLSLSTRDSLVRKLEYELKLKSERENHMARSFISGFSSLPNNGEVAIPIPTRSNYAALYDATTKVQERDDSPGNQQMETVHQEHIQTTAYSFVTKPDSHDDSSRCSKLTERVNSGAASRGPDEVSASPSTSSEEPLATDDTAPSVPAEWEASYAIVRDIQEADNFMTEIFEPTSPGEEEPIVSGLHAEIQRLQARIMSRLTEKEGKSVNNKPM